MTFEQYQQLRAAALAEYHTACKTIDEQYKALRSAPAARERDARKAFRLAKEQATYDRRRRSLLEDKAAFEENLSFCKRVAAAGFSSLDGLDDKAAAEQRAREAKHLAETATKCAVFQSDLDKVNEKLAALINPADYNL